MTRTKTDSFPVVTGAGTRLHSISRDEKIDRLRCHGALVLRDFELEPGAFIELGQELSSSFLNMSLDPRIREMVSADGVVAGVLKGQMHLLPHMERGYSPVKPELVFFHMVQRATSGGESLFVNSRRVMDNLPADIVTLLRSKRLTYSLRWEPQAWQGRYGSTPEAALERLARYPDVRAARFEDDVLCYEYLTSALVQSRLDPDPLPGFCNNMEGAYLVMRSPAGERSVHRPYVGFEDGTPLAEDLMGRIHAAVERSADEVDLQAGDIVVLDNYRWMHGRRSFEGTRTMHAIMGMAAF